MSWTLFTQIMILTTWTSVWVGLVVGMVATALSEDE